MKVLIAADIFPPQSGGPATYAVAIAKAFVEKGIGVKIVSLNSDGEHVTGNTHHVTKRNKLLRYWEYYNLLKKHGKDVDVIYAMGPVNAGYPALKVAQKLGKKFVVKVVGDYAWEQFQQGTKSKPSSRAQAEGEQKASFISVDGFQDIKVGGKIGWLKNVERKVVQSADKVIVPSSYLKTIVEGWGAKSENVEVVYNAVEFKEVEPMKKLEGEKWLVSVGRLVPWKGMDALIEIMPDLLQEYPELKLKIVGGGPEFENLESRIKNLELGDSVELIGNVSHDQALSYIASADVFVLNSGYEGLSHVILEAFMLRRIACASNKCGNPEVIIDGDGGTGYLFEYNNKEQIKKVLSKVLNFEKSVIPDQIYENMSQKIKTIFSFSNMNERTVLVLKEVCNS